MLLERVDIADGNPRKVVFTSDYLGQVFRRDESGGAGVAPHEVWYRYSGREMGYVANNGSADVDYAQSINQRSGAGVTPASFADFDLAHDHINAYEQGGRGGVYTVQSGDTLQSIAANLWGDASLWWKLAETNGLTAESTLVEGALLIIPMGVQSNANNASTFKPYDPLEVLGNLSPTSPKPGVGGKQCGAFGQFVLAAIAVAIVIQMGPWAMKEFGSLFGVAAGETTTALAAVAEGTATLAQIGAVAASPAAAGAVIAGGAVAGATASVVSQTVGVLTGIQEKFSWNAVAMAAIGGGVGGAVGLSPLRHLTGPLGAGVRGAASSAITQGLGVATGMQRKFSWAGVAAAGAGGALGHYVGEEIGLSNYAAGTDGHVSRSIIANGASALADAAARSLIEGSDFGDNLMAALPSAIANTIASSVARTREPAPATPQGSADDALSMRSLMRGDLGPHFRGPDGGGWDWLLHPFGIGLPQKQVRGAVEGDVIYVSAPRNRYGVPVAAVTLMAMQEYNYNLNPNAGYSPTSPAPTQRRAHEAPMTYVRNVNTSIQQNVTEPILQGGRWLSTIFTDPVEGASQMGQFFKSSAEGMERVARTDWAAATDNVMDYYGAAYERGGWEELLNVVSGQAGYVTPLVVGGPHGAEVNAFTFEERLVRAIRTGRAVDPTDLRAGLQAKTDQAMVMLAENPSLAREVLDPRSYQRLAEGGPTARLSYGYAVERLTARLVREDPALANILTHMDSRELRLSNGRSFSHPDFFAHDEFNVYYFDLTTSRGVQSHSNRWYDPYTQYIEYPRQPADLVFPK